MRYIALGGGKINALLVKLEVYMEHTTANYPGLDKFLDNEPSCVLSLPIDDAGTVHIAAMVYYHTAKPLQFYFVTDRSTEKCKLLVHKANLPAAVVVGAVPNTQFSLQMRGHVSVISPEGHDKKVAAFYRKYGGKENVDLADPKNVLLEFTPNWARVTDYSKGYDRALLDISGAK